MQANKGKTKYDVTAHEVSDFVRFIFQVIILCYAFVAKCRFVRQKGHTGELAASFIQIFTLTLSQDFLGERVLKTCSKITGEHPC